MGGSQARRNRRRALPEIPDFTDDGHHVRAAARRRALLFPAARGACGVLAALAALVPATAAAQGRLLPDVRYMAEPAADPTAPRIAAALMHSTLLEAPGPERPAFTVPDRGTSAGDVYAAVAIGAIIPLYQLAEWQDGGAVLVADARIFGRFRLNRAREDMGQDWYIGGGVEAARGDWSGRASIIHRSAHIGDEFAAATGAERIEFGNEELLLLTAWQAPAAVRLYAGGSWVFRSYLRWSPRFRDLEVWDRGTLQAGADREWQPSSDPRLRLFAGVDVRAVERTDWQPGYSAVLGGGVTTTRSLRLQLRFFDGMSDMGEFFLTRERYVSLELAAEL
jgi:hypothetical protein